MDPRDEDVDYLRDRIIIEEELRQQMEAEYMEAEYYEQLPAKITVEININKEN